MYWQAIANTPLSVTPLRNVPYNILICPKFEADGKPWVIFRKFIQNKKLRVIMSMTRAFLKLQLGDEN